MKTYALLDNADNLQKVQSFEEEAPQLAQAKGLRWMPWLEVPAPSCGEFETVSTDGVEIVDGVASTKWVVVEMSATQKATKLAQLKTAKNRQINDDREAVNFTAFSHAGKQIACDRFSRSDIDGMANQIGMLGGFPEGWPGYWKCADNTYLPMSTVEDFKAMYASMIAQGLYNFGVSQARKAALAAATTPEEVAAI